jgi:hypothetical protein
MFYMFKGQSPSWIFMKFFDLTFSGTVLPERDPAEVKLALARLFCIEDEASLEELFSGKTIVLRHHLDRKSAAEYFRQTAELGAKASLVESIDPPDSEAGAANGVRHPSRLHPVFTSERLEKSRVIEAEALQTAITSTRDQGNFHSLLSKHHEELCRLRTLMSQMKERSRQRYLALESRKKAFQRLADQELISAAEISNGALERTQAELAQIEARTAQLKADTESELGRLLREEKDRRTLSLEVVESLETLMHQTREREHARTLEIQAQREATRHAAELEVMRLQKLILDTQQQAEIEDARLLQELESAMSDTRLEIDSLEQKKAEEVAKIEQVTESLLKQQNDVKLRLEAETEAQRQKQQDLQKICVEEASRLIVQQHDIKIRLEKGIEEVDKAGKQLEAMTRKNLKKLYALEMQAKRRQNETLQTQLDQVMLKALANEVTMH